jgi:hypothetical protein
MEAFCRAVVLFTLAALTGCSARTGVVVRSPEFSPATIPANVTVELAPVADTVVHNAPAWSSQDLSAEPWVMVGSNGAGLVWMTYLRFDLSAVPAGWEPQVATLESDRLLTPQLPIGALRMQVDIRQIRGDWTEERVTWDSPVDADEDVVATCELIEDSLPTDSCDVTELVLASLREGRTNLGILLSPSDPTVDFRRRWPGLTGALPSETSSVVDTSVVADPTFRISLVLGSSAL